MLMPILYLAVIATLAHAVYTAHITHRAFTNFFRATENKPSYSGSSSEGLSAVPVTKEI